MEAAPRDSRHGEQKEEKEKWDFWSYSPAPGALSVFKGGREATLKSPEELDLRYSV